MFILDVPKTCCRCGQTKTWPDFPRDPTKPDGLSYACKTCKNAAARARYHQTPDAVRKRRRAEQKAWLAWIDQLARENGWPKKQPAKGGTPR